MLHGTEFHSASGSCLAGSVGSQITHPSVLGFTKVVRGLREKTRLFLFCSRECRHSASRCQLFYWKATCNLAFSFWRCVIVLEASLGPGMAVKVMHCPPLWAELNRLYLPFPRTPHSNSIIVYDSAPKYENDSFRRKSNSTMTTSLWLGSSRDPSRTKCESVPRNLRQEKFALFKSRMSLSCWFKNLKDAWDCRPSFCHWVWRMPPITLSILMVSFAFADSQGLCKTGVQRMRGLTEVTLCG